MRKLLILLLPILILINKCGKKNQVSLDIKSKGNLKEKIIKKIEDEDLEGLKLLLQNENYDLNQIENGETYLTIAINKSNEAIINYLILKGADPNLVINDKSILLSSLEKSLVEKGILKLIQNEKFLINQIELEKIVKILIEKEYTKILLLFIERNIINFDMKIQGKTILELSKESKSFLSQVILIEKENLYKGYVLLWQILQIYEKIPNSEKDLRNKVLDIFKQKFREISDYTNNIQKEDEKRQDISKKLIISKILISDEMNELLEYMIENEKVFNIIDKINDPKNSLLFKAIVANSLKNILTLLKSLKNSDNNFSFLANSFAINVIKNLTKDGSLLNDFNLDIFNRILEELYDKKIPFYKLEKSDFKKIKDYVKEFLLENSKAQLQEDFSKSTAFLLYSSFKYPEIFKTLLKYIVLDEEDFNHLINLSLIDLNAEILEILIDKSERVILKEKLLEIILEDVIDFEREIAYLEKISIFVPYVISNKLSKVENRNLFSKCILNLVEKIYIKMFENIQSDDIKEYIEKSDDNKKKLIELLENSRILIIVNLSELNESEFDYTKALRTLFEIFEISMKDIKKYYKKSNLLEILIKKNNLVFAKFLIEKNDFEIDYNITISKFIEKIYYNENVLIFSIKNNFLNLVKFFLEKSSFKIKINYIDENGKTALDYVKDKDSELYKYLVKKNAKTSAEIDNQIQELKKHQQQKEEIKNKKSTKPSSLTNEKELKSNEENTKIITDNDMFKQAVQDKDPNLIRKYILEDNRKIFEILGDGDLVKELIEFLDIEILNENGDNILFAAIKNNYIYTVKILINSKKFDIKRTDKNKNTILMVSINLPSSVIFKYLLQISDEILYFENDQNKNILDIAIENRNAEIINLILGTKKFENSNKSKIVVDLIFSKDENKKLEIIKLLIKDKFTFEKAYIDELMIKKEKIPNTIKLVLSKKFDELKDLISINAEKVQEKPEIKNIRIIEKTKIYSYSDIEDFKLSTDKIIKNNYKKFLEIVDHIKRYGTIEAETKKIADTNNLYEIIIGDTRIFYTIKTKTFIIMGIILNKDDSKTKSKIDYLKVIIKDFDNWNLDKFDDFEESEDEE